MRLPWVLPKNVDRLSLTKIYRFYAAQSCRHSTRGRVCSVSSAILKGLENHVHGGKIDRGADNTNVF